MKIGILGAGVSGLTCALKLEEAGFDDITVLEKESEIGGLAKSSIVKGYVFDLHGGHLFNSKHKDIKKWVFSMLPKENWRYQVRKAKVLYKNKILSYPFELSLSELSEDEAIDCLVDFVKSKDNPEPDNCYDWFRWHFGNAIASKYMIPFNKKIWAYDLKKLSTDWIKGKMPAPSIRQVVTSVLRKDPRERDMPHSTFYYPLKGGIQTLIASMAKRFKGSIINNYEAVSVEKVNKKFIINGQDKFDLLISSIFLKDLVKSMRDIPIRVRKSAQGLRSNSLTTTLCECDANDISWLYIPDESIPVHKMGFQGNISPFNCPEGKGSSVTLETIGRVNPEKQVSEFNKRHKLEQLKVGNIISFSFTQYAYIVYDNNYSGKLKCINSYLNELGIVRVGRFAEWKYYNMDICMKSAFDAVKKIVRTNK